MNNTLPLAAIKRLFIVIGMLLALQVSAQKNNAKDSTIYYLNKFSGSAKTDSVLLNNIFRLNISTSPSILADTGFLKAMNRLKGILKPDQYYVLNHYFLEMACYKSTYGEYDYPINYGLRNIEELKQYTNITQRYILLKTMRDIRIPFRNSSRIYEGIETYSTFSSYFYQRKDSAAVSIADNVIASFYITLSMMDRAIYFQLRSIDFLDNQTFQPDTSYLGYGSPPNIGLIGKINRKAVLAEYFIEDDNPVKALEQIYDVFTLTKAEFPDQLAGPIYVYLQAARAHVLLGTDSTDYYFKKMRENLKEPQKDLPGGFGHYYQAKSYGYYTSGKLDSAEVNILKCIKVMEDYKLHITSDRGSLTPAYYLALIRIRQGRYNDAIAQLISEIDKLTTLNLRKKTLREIKLLAEAYTLKSDFKNATKTWEAYNKLQDEMITAEKNNRSISFDIEKRMAENEKAVQLLETENQYNHKKQYYLFGILGLLLVLAFGLLTRNRYKQKANKELLHKNQEIETTLRKLQSTQAQLIQSEKMASLGELTAGIAHEIQNPLNFVNNFSEVNAELIDELKAELATGNLQLANELASDIKDNEQKIVHHGKRADAIVKSMLQHSRTGSGQKELTDINVMADEYLRLAYHGMRAKDKSFNVDYKLDLDPKLPKIMVMPQEIGRVLLNLINNAFQALNSAPYPPEGGHKRTPTVKVGTKHVPPLGGRGQFAEISISDNGPGIPESIKDKIFQPFFTTKPAGQGTGLGLSLSYDIIKAHGGELKVETKEGEGTEFIIQLPTI